MKQLITLATLTLTAFYSYSQLPGLQDCIQYAYNHHPNIQSAERQLERYRMEQKAIFNPDALQLNYTNGNINSGMVDYAVDISQSFDFPTEYFTHNALNKKIVQIGHQELNLQKLSIKKEVKSAYNTLLFQKSRYILLNQFNTHLNNFETIAQDHFLQDSTTELEYAAAKARHQEILVMINQQQLEIAYALNNLIRWTGNRNIVDIKDSTIKKSSSQYISPDSKESLYKSLQESHFELSQQELRAEKAALTPDITLGYFNQQIDGIGGFDGILIGTSIPLIFSGQSKMIKAAKIETERQEKEVEAIELMIDMEISNHLINLEKYDNMISFFELQGALLSDQLMKSLDMKFKNNEIDYVEYIRDLDQAFDLRIQYLENLYNYNESLYNLELLQSTGID